MPRREDDDVAPRPDAPSTRTLTFVGGFALAIAATLAVFLTDNAQYLRIAVVAVAWAFVLATFAAGRRQADRTAAALRGAPRTGPPAGRRRRRGGAPRGVGAGPRPGGRPPPRVRTRAGERDPP